MKLPIGIEKDTGVVYSASELDRETQRGLNCNCQCPECKIDLIAKLGEVQIKHFAHATGSGTRKCQETALHRLGKHVLSNIRSILLCPYEVEQKKEKDTLGRVYFSESNTLFGMKEVSIEKIEEEKSIGSIRSDVFANAKYEKVSVEINFEVKVWHEVDEEKYQKIKSLDVNTIEIDISQLLAVDIVDFECVRKEINKPYNQNIIHLSRKFVDELDRFNEAKLHRKIENINYQLSKWLHNIESELRVEGYKLPRYYFEFNNLPKTKFAEFITKKIPNEPLVSELVEVIAFTHVRDGLFKLKLNTRDETRTIKVILKDDIGFRYTNEVTPDEDYLTMSTNCLGNSVDDFVVEWGRNSQAESYIKTCNGIIDAELKEKKAYDDKKLLICLDEVKGLISSGKQNVNENYNKIKNRSIFNYKEMVGKGINAKYLKSLLNEDVDRNYIYGCQPKIWQMILIRDMFWVNNRGVNVKYSVERLEVLDVMPVEPYRQLLFQSKLLKEKDIEFPFKTPYKIMIAFLDHLSSQDFLYKEMGIGYVKRFSFGQEYKKL